MFCTEAPLLSLLFDSSAHPFYATRNADGSIAPVYHSDGHLVELSKTLQLNVD
jgi:hypothetical protein